ncbi:MAG: hypothetical protein C3F07_17435 [Anaerolineales bacterium]|nr:MAG: hypothetical protein C3F07_17435 [Anaerolineales bacterium]
MFERKTWFIEAPSKLPGSWRMADIPPSHYQFGKSGKPFFLLCLSKNNHVQFLKEETIAGYKGYS